MPIYSYRCKNCGEISDFLCGITTQAPEIKCKKCKSTALERVLSNFSIAGSSASQDKCTGCRATTCEGCF